MIPVTIDCETHLIGPETTLPKVVCMGVAVRISGNIHRSIYAGHDAYEALVGLLQDPDVLLVNQSISFDLGVMYSTFNDDHPELITLIFDALAADRITDISIREKLISLATHGNLEYIEIAEGVNKKIGYSLADLSNFYLGRIRDDKKEDSWRTNFHLLDGVPVEDYPQDAVDYLNLDISDPLEVYELQEERIESEYIRDHMNACQFRRTEFDFVLKLITAWGFDTDEEFKERLQEKVNEEYHHVDSMRKLLKAGWLRPGSDARPYKNGALNPDGTPKMVAAKKPTKNKKVIQAYVAEACAQHGVKVRYTDPSDKYPEGQVSFNKEALMDLSGLDPVIDEFVTRNVLEKLATTEIPRMCGGRIVRPNFDVLKKTGRISSFGGGKKALYPAFNSQNVDPRARGAFVARPGHVMVSVDYSANELVSAAQVYLNVVGWSVLADTINAGIGPHEYLGAQLAIYLDDDFRDECEELDCKTPMDVYELFYSLKSEDSCGPGCGSREKKCHLVGCRKGFYKHYRTFAKPTGLGYPGGLGPKTFITYAKATFGIEVDLETATTLRAIWRSTYPEVMLYFKWINHSCIDPRRKDRYCYTSPMGMVRSGCMYTEAANGCALQTPSAEWMMMACIKIVREQYDPTLESCLLGTHTLTPLHDEIIAEIPEDEHMTERSCRIAAIMIEAGEEVAPDLTHQADPALMRVWNKQVDTVWCPETSTLGIWSPK